MCAAQFFGDLSPFQVLVAITTFVTGGYTFYKAFLETAKVGAYPGDRITLVLSGSGGCLKFQLRANLVNHAVKTGTVHRLEARITGPNGFDHRFQWCLFFEYVSGARAVQPGKDPHPVSVVGKGSELLLAEFEVVPANAVPTWSTGRYQVNLFGWVNRKGRMEAPNLSSQFHFSVDDGLRTRLTDDRPGQPIIIHLPFEEWALPG